MQNLFQASHNTLPDKKIKVFRTIIFLLMLAILNTGVLLAQDEQPVITAAEKAQVIDSLATHMANDYVFADLGSKVAALLRENLKQGIYDRIDNGDKFAEQLTKDIESINNDKHLRIYYGPERIKQDKQAAQDDNEAQKAIERQNRVANYGFKEAKIMPGNIGYLKFNSFDGTGAGLKVAIGTMAFLANCDVLIFDIRDNGGGDPRMVQLLLSYLYNEDEEVHINDFFVRKTNDYQQYWAMPYCPGTRMPDVNVYVLTSNYTFSCAEEFAYDLQNLKRATLVGETTGGGAHPVSFYYLNDNFVASIPFGRAVNPVSKTNWEGKGVEPEVKVSSAQALDTAYKLALEKLRDKETDETARFTYQWAIDGLDAALQPVKISEKLLKSYTGVYEVRTITLENGNLYYQREGRDKLKMIPITDDYFGFKEIDYFRLKVVIKDGKAIRLEGHYNDGRIDLSEKTK
jgi:retinol-binding protein 3